MDPEVLSPENSLKALAILSAIPVTVFALWADGYGKHLQELAIKHPDYDKEAEQEKIRIAGILGLLLQFTLFLSSSELREAFPLLTNLIFIGAVFIQIGVQSRLEKMIKDSDKEPSEEILGILARTGVSWLIGLTVQIVILFGSVRAGIALAAQLHFSSTPSGFLTLFLGIGGVGMGLFINYALGPIYFKSILPHTPAIEPELLARLHSCFEKLRLRAPDFFIINLEKFKITTISWVGFQTGKGPFRPVFSISRWMLTTLTVAELDALILNQATHIALHHPRKRFFLTLGLISGTTLVALSSVFIFQHVLSPKVAIDLIGPAVALFSFILCFRVLALQSKKHEFETDVYTIEHLGVQMENLIEALVKVDQQLQPNPASVNPVHPDTQERINSLRAYFERKGQERVTDRAA